MTTTTIAVPEVVTDPVPIDRNARRRQAAAARREAENFYDGWAESHLNPLSRDEKVVIAHMRGWLHFGPLCRLCKVESHIATALTQVKP